jgi:hypothetical protein
MCEYANDELSLRPNTVSGLRQFRNCKVAAALRLNLHIYKSNHLHILTSDNLQMLLMWKYANDHQS